MQVRKAAFSGSWYPADPEIAKARIHQFLGETRCAASAPLSPVGGIVPHAGWFFSGSIACAVIHCIAAARASETDVVVLFGMHLPPGAPFHIMPEGAWETPFGPVPVDTELAEALIRRHAFTRETPSRFQQDNTIEVQMPFVRHFFPNSRVVAMGVPPTAEALTLAADLVEAAAERSLSIVVIGSTDLTHYGPNYGFIPKGRGLATVSWVRKENDRRVIEAMERMDPLAVIRESLENKNACCGGAAAAAIAAGKAMGATRATPIAYTTSHEKHPEDSFVGYVGMVF